MKKINKGFTLIELLVVISIIGLLSSVVLASLNSARAKARDAVRKQDLKQISLALELFYDKNGKYPPETLCTDRSIGASDCGNAGGSGDWDANSDLRDLITAGFISILPKDPINDTNYYYYFEPDGVGQGTPACTSANNSCRYVLRARLEGGGYFYNDSFGVGIR